MEFPSNRLVRTVILLLICHYASIASTVQAEQANSQKDVTQIINIFDALVQYPSPSWVTPEVPLHGSEYYRNAQGNQFIFEQIPKGEFFESWTKLYAIGGLYAPGVPLQSFVADSLGTYLKFCGKQHFRIQRVGVSENPFVVIIYCENSPNGPTKFGYGDGKGEITIMWIGHFKNTLMKVYQHWRGKRFSVLDKTSWPVNVAEVQMMARRFATIRVTPNPKHK